MAQPTVGVFALQGDVREHLQMLGAAGAKACSVRRPAELADVDAIVLPGGESTTMYKLANVFELFEPLRDHIAAGMPVLGTCAGMIMLADSIEGGIEGQQTLGGLDVVVRRNAFGRQVDSFESDVDFAPFDEPFHAVFIRAPWVEKVGDDVEVLATLPRAAAPPSGAGEPASARSREGATSPATSGQGAATSAGLGSISGGRSRESSTNSPGGPAGGQPPRYGGPPVGQPLGSSNPAGGQPLKYGGPEPAVGRIVAVRQGAVVATSFHPELTSDDRVHRYFVDLVRSS